MDIILKLTNWKSITFRELEYRCNFDDKWELDTKWGLAIYSQKNNLNIITETK